MEEGHQPHASNQNVDDAIRPTHCQVISSELLDRPGTSHRQFAFFLNSIEPDQLRMISNYANTISLGKKVHRMRVFDVR